MRALLLLLLLLLLPACASVVVVEGREMNEEYWQRDVETITSEAAFLFKCPRESIKPTILKTWPDITGEIATVVGVDACGTSAVYKRVDGKWFMDAARTDDAPPPPAATE